MLDPDLATIETTGLGGRFRSYKFRCLSIFLITFGFSINAITHILPWHLGQVRGSTSFTRLNRVPFGKFNWVNFLDQAGPVFSELNIHIPGDFAFFKSILSTRCLKRRSRVRQSIRCATIVRLPFQLSTNCRQPHASPLKHF